MTAGKGKHMNRKLALLVFAAMLVAGLAFAKAKEGSKPDKDYDFKTVKKTGMEWSFFSGVTKGAKTGVKNSVDVIKEEKGEKDAWKKKEKK